MKVMIGIPCYTGRICVQTMRILMGDCIKLLSRGDSFAFAEDVGNSDIAGSRGSILATFIRSDFDCLVFIDDDVTWDKNGLIRLVDHPVDLVGGIYPKKTEELMWPFRMEVGMDGMPNEETGLVEVSGLPGGFMKISRNCAESMIAHYTRKTKKSIGEASEFWPVFDPYYTEDDRLSEDLAFCQRWRDMGGKVWGDFEIGMGHIGFKNYQGHVGNHLRSLQNNVK